MSTLNNIVGLPWQLAEGLLQAASIPYRVVIGKNYNRFFSIIEESNYYVARVKRIQNDTSEELEILLYKPMIMSDLYQSKEVEYAKEILEGKDNNKQ